MTFPVQVGPSSITINRDDRFLVCQPDGRILGGPDDGFFTRDTRFISGWDLRINGQRPVLLNSAPIQFFSARFEYTNESFLDDAGRVDRQTLGIRVDRTVSGGIHEDLDITTTRRRAVRLTIEVAIESDFADIFDVRSDALVRRGVVNTRWFRSRRELRTTYENATFRRAAHRRPSTRPMPSRSTRTAASCSSRRSRRRARGTPASAGCRSPSRTRRAGRRRSAATRSSRPVPATAPRLPEVTHRDAERHRPTGMGAGRPRHGGAPPRGPDVRARRLHPGGRRALVRDAVRARHAGRLDAGDLGLPGVRDRRAPPARAQCRPTEDDPERDMEPGKIPHEVRHGELAQLGILPYQPYYGTHDATSLYLIVYSYLYQWLGDVAVLERYLPNAEAALRWIDRFGDRDRDGFQEYKTRSSHGYYNQGWKDAGDAIPHEDGTLAPLPLATCRAPGLRPRREGPDGRRLRAARPESRRPPPATRGEASCTSVSTRRSGGRRRGPTTSASTATKQPIRSVASNSGHLLQSGIVPDRARRPGREATARRRHVVGLGHPDPVRRARRLQPVQLPHGHRLAPRQRDDRGGFRRYGFTAEAARVAKGLFDVAERQVAYRLPELFAGLPRREASFPVQYLGANVPQAWAAGSILRLIAVLAGIHATSDRDGSRALRESGAARTGCRS